MGDTFNLSGDYRDGVQYFKCTFLLPADEQDHFEALLKTAGEKLATLPIDTIPEVSPLPPGSCLPLRHNPLFVGREADLKALAGIMQAGRVAAVGQLVAAMGLGGIGKTQLASEFCHRYGQYFSGGVFWMSFADPDQVPTEISRCGGIEGMDLAEEFSKRSLEEQVLRVFTAWHSPLPRLLVFDNCEDPELISRWLPRSGGCRIIVTSRRDRWDPALGIQPLALGVLSPSESLTLLGEYRPDLQGDPRLAVIAEALGRLPLALHLAGSYLARYEHSPLGDPGRYLDKLQAPELLAHPSLTSSDGHNPTEHEQHVGKTFALSWDQLDPEDATDATALNLLSEAAVLAPGEPIFRDQLLEVSQTDEADEDFLASQTDALGKLLGLGLLQSEVDGTLVIHRLVGLFVRQQSLDWTGTCSRVENYFGNLSTELNQLGLPAPPLPWRAHLKHLAVQAEERGSEMAGWLWNDWGYQLKMAADYAGARSAFERALVIDEAAYGPDHPSVARDVSNLGLVLQALGDFTGARSAFERALGIVEAVYGPDHPKVAIFVNNLGEVLRVLGELTGARSAIERALGIDEAANGHDHPNVARDINNLGMVLHALGDLTGAQSAFERALGVSEKAYGPDHPIVAIYINNLGMVLQDLDDLTGARLAYERALGIDEAAWGADHPSVARDLNNLGEVLRVLGDLTGARLAYERALGIVEAACGLDHPNIAICVNNLGLVLQELGDLSGARSALERALGIDEAVYGPDHPSVARDVYNLGVVLQVLGDLLGARSAFERALSISEQFLGSDHPTTKTFAKSLNNLTEQKASVFSLLINKFRRDHE